MTGTRVLWIHMNRHVTHQSKWTVIRLIVDDTWKISKYLSLNSFDRSIEKFSNFDRKTHFYVRNSIVGVKMFHMFYFKCSISAVLFNVLQLDNIIIFFVFLDLNLFI